MSSDFLSCAMVLEEAGPAVKAAVSDAITTCPLLGQLLKKVQFPLRKVTDFFVQSGMGWDMASAKAVAKALVPRIKHVEEVSVYMFTAACRDYVAKGKFSGTITIGNVREAFANKLGLPILRFTNRLPFSEMRVLFDEDEPLCMSEVDKDGDVIVRAAMTQEEVDQAAANASIAIFYVKFKLVGTAEAAAPDVENFGARVCVHSEVGLIMRTLGQIGLPPMKLLHEGTTLQPEKTLGDYGICGEEVLYVSLL